MIKNLKKAFTIIELVIVIAVIAILAAVMIPTYSSLVEKANQSADIQAVKQINTILATYNDGSITNVAEAIKALDKDNIDLEDYKALQKDHYIFFYMDGKTPKVVYTDKDYKAIYPENANISGVQLMSLYGSIPESDAYEDEITTAEGTKLITIDNEKELVHLMNNISKYSNDSSIKTINITLNADVDLKGATSSFGEIGNNQNVVFDANNHKISGIRADSNSEVGTWNNEPKNYGFALFNHVKSGSEVTVKNLNISNVIVKDTSANDYAFGHSAVLFGKVEGTVNVENVIISNCKVYGGGKVGALIGYLSGSAYLKDVVVKDTDLYGVSFIAKLIGWVSNESGKIEFKNSPTVTNVNTYLSSNESAWTKMWGGSTDISFVTGGVLDINEVKAYINGSTNTYIPFKESENNALQNKGYLFGMTTDDYYWIGGKTAAEFEINGITYNSNSNNTYAYASKSGNEGYSAN